MADDMGYGDVHAVNPGSTIPTPHLDRLGEFAPCMHATRA